MGKYKLYSKEFKLEAVRLIESSDKPGAAVARELGIRRNQLYKWQEQMKTKGKEGVFPGHGRRAGTEAANNRREQSGTTIIYYFDA